MGRHDRGGIKPSEKPGQFYCGVTDDGDRRYGLFEVVDQADGDKSQRPRTRSDCMSVSVFPADE